MSALNVMSEQPEDPDAVWDSAMSTAHRGVVGVLGELLEQVARQVGIEADVVLRIALRRVSQWFAEIDEERLPGDDD